MPRPRLPASSDRGQANGYKSGFEERIAQELTALGVPVKYEAEVISYSQPEKARKYHPDFKLPNGIFIETKGYLVTADRQKHLLIKAQHPNIDIRFVFGNARNRINKGSPTTYADWANKNGFRWAEKHIPEEWIRETRNN